MLPPTSGPSLCRAHPPWPPHPQLALTTTATRLAGCHAPAPGGPTTQLAVGLQPPPPYPPQVAGSRVHGLAGCFPSPRWQPGPPAHTRGSSLASAGAAPLPPALFVAASSYR